MLSNAKMQTKKTMDLGTRCTALAERVLPIFLEYLSPPALSRSKCWRSDSDIFSLPSVGAGTGTFSSIRTSSVISSTAEVGQTWYKGKSVKAEAEAAAAAAEWRSIYQVNLHFATGKVPLPLRGCVRLTVCRGIAGELDGVLKFFRLGWEVARHRWLCGVLRKVLVLLGSTRYRRKNMSQPAK